MDGYEQKHRRKPYLNTQTLMTESLKPLPRQYFPHQSRVGRNISDCGSPVCFSGLKKSIEYLDNDLFPQAKTQFSVSIRDHYKSMHLGTVHELIANVRDRKSNIEDLLRSEEHKAEHQNQDLVQIGVSIRRLKKVVRLMEIVCKIILGDDGTKDQPMSMAASFNSLPHQEILHQDISAMRMGNLEHQLQTKNQEIKRLKKLVDIMAVPENQKSKKQQNNRLSTFYSVSEKQCFDAAVQAEELRLSTKSSANQHQIKQIQNKGLKSQRVLQMQLVKPLKENQGQNRRQCGLLVSIFDADEADEQDKVFQRVMHGKLGVQNLDTITVFPKLNFLKRYKSVVKIAMNSINCLLSVIKTEEYEEEIGEIEKELFNLAEEFNNSYQKSSGQQNWQLIQRIKYELEKIYTQTHQIFKRMRY